MDVAKKVGGSLIALLLMLLCQNNSVCRQSNNDMECSGADTLQGNATTYNSYCNAIYNYCIDYPDWLLIPQNESQNGDGRIFTDKSGHEILRVYGIRMLDPEGGDHQLQDQFAKDIGDAVSGSAGNKLEVTYKKLGKTFYVISGYKGGKVYYQKMIETKEGFANMILQYSVNDSIVFNKVVGAVARSFH